MAIDWPSFVLGVFGTLGGIALWISVAITREQANNPWEFETWRGP
jgi:hypothetical protein